MSLIKEVRLGLLALDQSNKSLLKFSLVMASFFLVLCFTNFFWGEVKNNSIILFVVALLFLLPGLIYPKLLKPLHSIWMTFALSMGYIMSRLILFIVYYVAITPISLFFRLIKKDILDQKIDNNASSYWKRREKNRDGLEGLERQF